MAHKFFWPKIVYGQTKILLTFFWGLVVRLVVRLVRLAETGGKTGGETGPPLANSPTMHSRVVCKDPKTLFFFKRQNHQNGKKKKNCVIAWEY